MVIKIPQPIRSLFFANKRVNYGQYSVVKPGIVSKQRLVPDHIQKPSYYKSGEPLECIDSPEIKTSEQIQKLRDSCKLAANILKKVGDHIRVGQTTDEIDELVHSLSIENNSYPSPLNYRHFPKSVCTSVNNVACHGIPDDRPLEDGDIINVDITIFFNGYHGDCSKTYLVGNVDEMGRKLVEATEICLNHGISMCGPGRFFRDIGARIEAKAFELGFNIVPPFIGHGIGYYFHGPPDIYHVRNNYPGRMESGMTFTVEPILTQGEEMFHILEDNWTAITDDAARTAQFEHTVLITDTGVDILTIPD